MGGSAQIARDVAHKFLRIGVRANVFDDSHMMLMSAALLKEGDMRHRLFPFGNTTAVLEGIQLARRNRRADHRITNYGASPLAQAADVVLCSTAQGSPLMGENAAAASPSSTFSTRFSSPSRSAIRAAERNLKHTMSAVSQTKRSHLMSSSPLVTVFGSLHYDIAVFGPCRPRKGETVTGTSWHPKSGW